jgi:prepilin-type N-terminal cleavage/methylation domain-containing protein
MLRTHHRRTRGFTMIELLLALAMTAFLLAAAAACAVRDLTCIDSSSFVVHRFRPRHGRMRYIAKVKAWMDR